MRLCRAALPSLAAALPFDPATLRTGIVHLGIGAFQRAHQAAYTQPLLAEDPSWGTLGASLRRADTSQALAPQDFLYTLAERDGAGERLTIIAALTGILGPADGPALLAAMSAPDTRIVSLTITEKGYHRAPGGGLDEDAPAIRADLTRQVPATAPGLIVAALRARQAAGLPPFTVLSCDNLPANGPTTARILAGYARLAGVPGVMDAVPCPSTMVDRIVPATTDADRARISAALGAEDAWPVLAEPFRQWVIEDSFCAGRPLWEQTGATLVHDVRPWEEMKLRMLNGAHSTIAYLGVLAGWETVADAMAVPALARAAARLMDEAAETLQMPPGTDLAGYREQLLQRFRNPALRHRTAQIAMDGSQKLPQRLLAPAAGRLAAGRPAGLAALGVAAWLRVAGTAGLDDPMAATVCALAHPAQPPAQIVRRLFTETAIVPPDAQRPGLELAVTAALEQLARHGVAATLEAA